MVYYTALPPRESLCQCAGKEAPADSQSSYSRGPVRILFRLWNSRSLLRSCKATAGVVEVCPYNRNVFCRLEKAYDHVC